MYQRGRVRSCTDFYKLAQEIHAELQMSQEFYLFSSSLNQEQPIQNTEKFTFSSACRVSDTLKSSPGSGGGGWTTQSDKKYTNKKKLIQKKLLNKHFQPDRTQHRVLTRLTILRRRKRLYISQLCPFSRLPEWTKKLKVQDFSMLFYFIGTKADKRSCTQTVNKSWCLRG